MKNLKKGEPKMKKSKRGRPSIRPSEKRVAVTFMMDRKVAEAVKKIPNKNQIVEELFARLITEISG